MAAYHRFVRPIVSTGAGCDWLCWPYLAAQPQGRVLAVTIRMGEFPETIISV
jgi:hypothetical protein